MNEFALMQKECNEAALVAISPILEERSGVIAPNSAMDTSAECRRSSRKKIIKFDVRDLLNKHRKPHKIQIEARIDSNAPSISSKVTTSAGACDSESNAANIKEKCFIEKTSIIQRSVAFEHSQHGPTQVPIPLKTEIFKPNQASSLIVAQMQSTSPSTSTLNQVKQKQLKSPAYALTETDVVIPKRRGRPPKNRSLIEKPNEEEIKTHTARAPITANSSENQSIEILKTEFKEQIEKSLLETDIPEADLSSKAIDSSAATEFTGLITLKNPSEDCNKDVNLMDQQQSTSISNAIVEETCTKIERNEVDNIRSSVTTCDTSNTNKDNDTQNTSEKTCESTEVDKKIFVGEPLSDVKLTSEGFSEENLSKPKAESYASITLPLKKQISKYSQEIQNEANEDTSENYTQVSDILAKETTTIEKDFIADIEATRKMSTPTPQRSERRSGRRLGDGSNKTLEETFAEIAANSSKAILEQKVSEHSISEPSLLTEMDSIPQKIEEEQDSSRSMSPKDQTTDQEALPTKRRGRKPKPKPVVVEDNKLKTTAATEEQETLIKACDNFKIDTDASEEQLRGEAAIETEEKHLTASTENEKQNKDCPSITVKTPETLKTLTDENNIVPTQSKLELSAKEIELTVTPVSAEKTESQCKETISRRKERSEETTPNKKSSNHHKHHKTDLTPPKSSSTEKKKKHKSHETDEAHKRDRKSLDMSRKLKSFREKFGEEAMQKTTSTSESGKKVRDKSIDADNRKGSTADNTKKLTLTSPESSADENNQKAAIISKDVSLIDDVKKFKEKTASETLKKSAPSYKERSAVEILKKSSLLSPEVQSDKSEQKIIATAAAKEKLMSLTTPTKEKFDNENFKKSTPIIKERSAAVDSLKKPALLSSEKSADESQQKSSKATKEKPFLDDVRKFSSTNKDKVSSEGLKKTKYALESYAKKPSSSCKEKLIEEGTKKLSPTTDERQKKLPALTKEKNVDDILKKAFSASKEKSTTESTGKAEKPFDEALMFSPLDEKKKPDKKKHKLKSQEAQSATSTLKAVMGSVTPSSFSKESSTKLSSSTKSQDSKSHKRKRKHKESPLKETTSICKSTSKLLENSDEKSQKSSDSKDENKTFKKELKDAKKQARKERQKKLKEAFEAAMKESHEEKKQTQPEVQVESVKDELNTPECDSVMHEIIMPPTPGESDAGIDHISKPCSPIEQSAEVKSTTVVESDPLYDIEKFIEAGVNLLKRDYKLDEDEEVAKTKESDAPEEIVEKLKVESANEVENPSVFHAAEVGDVEHTTAIVELDTKSESTSHEALDFYETPASTPASTTPSTSPTPTDNSVDTYYYSDGVRRSHRLKKITNAPKALVGRGLVRDRDRERLAMRDDVETKSYYSIEDHLMDLAEVEAKNAKFLKEMEERLSNFEVIKENEYHCERVVSREARKMVCDCFLTPEEAERGELGCGEDCLNRLLMIECGVNCKVGERCTNNRFQKYLCAPCRVFRTEKKGFGIMADVEIHPGEFIMEYVGEVLDSEEFEERRVAYSKDKNRHYYFMALRSDAIIDATIKGNVSRFINHSCDPNAETQKWTVNGELRIGFFSRKNIMPGEEITFDYQYQRYGREAQRCYCESANCRGWIGEEPASDEEEQVDDEEDEDDDEDDDDEYDEDESDVVSMVKGLMSVEDGEDEDGKDEIMSEEQRQNIQDAAVKAQLRKNQSLESTEGSSIREPSLDGESDESKQKFMAYLSKISAKIELHKKSVREEKKRKRKQRKQAAIDRRPPTNAATRFLEDPDLEDEIDFLSRCGLKNQSDTLRLSRLMVRAKLVPTRLNLLAILRAGELPCRRLFLDYHGLHLLHGWINEDGRTDMTIRMALLETLESLPIPNKTILTESKVYQAIRGWCNSDTLLSNSKIEGSSSSPSDDSSKESATEGGTAEKQTSNANADAETTAAGDNESPKSELEKLALKLLNSWDNLPEIFRIPKRERIEQMKEHEREADRQYAATVEADNEDHQKELSTDRYQRDRFERRFGKPQGSRTITVLGSGGMGTSSKRLMNSDILSLEDTKHLSKEQRRELFAAKVARDEAEKRQAERRREFETKCTFFGMDPSTTRPEDIPFSVSDTGKWYNQRRQIIATPPAFQHVPTPVKAMSTNPADYYLPSAATKLPPEWAYAITDQGKIYYYHLKHRVPQWEPPTLEQINKTKWSDDESETDEDESENFRELSEERIKEIEAIETQEELNALLKKIIQEQRQARYKRLVDERPISPRREEDRIYNQIEMRKYKENKEKIKKRKEEIRRRRSEAIKNSVLNMCTFGSLDEKPSTSAAAVGLLTDSVKTDTESSDIPNDALPIQDYLLSSDEDNEDIDEMKAECNNSPLLDKIVQGDKIVDELDALTTKRQLKRPLPPHRDFSFDLNISNNMSSESLFSTIEKIEHKKRKQEKREKSKRSKESSDAKYRRLKEKFRCEIAGIIVQHLKPYRKDSCIFGRIKSNEDFNHLAKKLTHFVMIKELKYCESVGQTLVVTESVKNKSREFIRKYMAKYEAGYIKPDNDPEFKDIPYTL